MYRSHISAFDPVCPQVVGMDTWNPLTGECVPGPASGIVPKTGVKWEPFVVTSPWLNPSEFDKLHEQMGRLAPEAQDYAAGTEKAGNALLLLGIAAVAGFVLLTKR